MEAQRRASEAEKNFIATKLKEEVDHQLVKDVTEQVLQSIPHHLFSSGQMPRLHLLYSLNLMFSPFLKSMYKFLSCI